jgi:hypothetical protein
MKKLEKIAYVEKEYQLNKEKGIVVIERTNEEFDKLIRIRNYNGGLPISEIHQKIALLKPQNYRIIDIPVGGDAPKDFIKMYEYGNSKKGKEGTWKEFIAKVGHKWYPLESITEYMMNKIGEVIGLNMAKSQLRIAHGQIRFLSQYFLKRKEETIMHGSQIYSTHLAEDDEIFVDEIEQKGLSRSLLSFQFTDEAVQGVFREEHKNIMQELVKLLVFDAITGNNDRHFYNWAVITNIISDDKPYFSPIYDTARGLFWNRSDDMIDKKFYEGKGKTRKIKVPTLEKYMNASRPKIGWDGWQGKKEINHFQLIELVYNNYPEYKNTCNLLLNDVHLQKIYTLLEDEFKLFFTNDRYVLVRECIKKRFEHLQHLCK